MRRNRRHLTALIATVFCLCAVFASFGAAEGIPTPDGHLQTDEDKLFEFWSQPAGGTGLTNGEAVYAFDFPSAETNPGMEYFYSGSTEYGGGYDTNLVMWEQGGGIEEISVFRLRWDLLFSAHDIENDEWACGCIAQYAPDLFGELDLSGTTTHAVNSEGGSTHISALNLNDCANLTAVAFTDQAFCREFSALNCPQLSSIDARRCDYRRINVQPKDYSSSVELYSVGNGSVGLYGRDGSYTAEASGAGFVGWFSNGLCVSTNPLLNIAEGIRAAACFAGDVNGDGAINITDSLLIMRCALEIGDELPLAAADADCNGAVGIPDALLTARVAMGN